MQTFLKSFIVLVAALAGFSGSVRAALVNANIGNPAVGGSVTSIGNGYNLSGAGTNIAGVADQFSLAHETVAGDFDYKVRLQSLSANDAYALAGVMARETWDANSRFAASVAGPSLSGCFFLRRTNVGANTTFGNNVPANYPYTWLRLTRAGNVFTAYAGIDGQNWVSLGTATIAMPPSVYLGYAICGANTSQAATAEVRDISTTPGGTVIPNFANTVEPLGPSSRRSGLVISEIMYNPRERADTNKLGFIEIFNSDPIFEDISGYRITGDIGFTFPTGTVLQAGAFIVVAESPADLQAEYGITGVFGPYTNVLSKTAGTVRLRNERDAIIQEVEYESRAPWPLPADGAGHSLALTRPSYGENDSRAWSASDVIGGSPGRAESIGPEPLRNLVINEFLARTVLPAEDFIELYNHGTTPLDITGCWLSDSPSTNKFRITNNIVIPARGFEVFDESALGFGLSSSGERIYLVNSNQTRVLDAWSFEAQADLISRGRYPDGSENVQELAALTPGATNAPSLRRDIVINEIMYNPISSDNDDEFVELYNRGTNTVNLTGWRFEDGVDFTFPTNASLAPGAYVVVARSKNRMLANYSNLNSTNLFGNFDGNLSNGGERLALAMPSPLVGTNGVTNILYVVVDEVSYGEGRWGIWADGGGSSLELIDANSDNRHAANWTDSDETAKSEWTSISHQELMDHVYPVGTTGNQLNEVQIMLMGTGEALVDDVVVSTNLAGANYVANGDFSGGLSGWLIQGNHVRSSLEPAGSNNPTASLHLRASGAGDNGANRVEKDLTSTLPPNIQGTLRASVRWLKGHPNLLIRLHGGGLEKVVPLLVPTDLGTPGARNSRAVINAGPVINALSHFPVLPAAGAPVTVSAAVSDPNGLAQVVVRYRNDTTSPGVNVDVPMNDAGVNGDLVAGDGVYAGIIPGQPVNNLVAFHVRATDGFSPGATSVYPEISNRHEALVRFGDTLPIGGLGVYRLWMTASNISLWGAREKLSNEALDGTFVYGNRVIYGMSARYRGSPFIRPGYNTPIGNACAYVWNFPSDEMFLGQDEANLDSLEPGGRDSTALREITSFTFAKHIGVQFSRQRFVHVVINGVANANRNIPIYTDSQQPDGGYMSMWFPDNDNGDIYKIDDWFEFDDTPGMQNNKSASLQNFTTVGGVKKQARYRWNWEKKFNGGYNDDYSSLYSAINALAAPDAIYVSQVEGILDIENWMTVLALGHTVGDWDRYGYNRGKNTFAYRPVAGKFNMLVWDLDFAIGCNGGHGPTQDLFSLAQGGDTGSDNMPEVNRLYTHPHFRRIYLRALQRIANGPLQDSAFMPILDARYRALQANGVVSVSPYIGSGAQGISLPAWIQQRRAYILTGSGLIPSATFGLTSTSIMVSSNLALISGTAPVGIKTIEFNGVAWPITWTSTTAWTARVPVGIGTTNFIVLGRDVSGALVAGASNQVSVTFSGSTTPPDGLIVFNEIMFNPLIAGAEYVELFNRSTNVTFDISGWRVNGLDYTFPAGSYIAPRGFLVLARDRAFFSSAYGLSVPVFDTYLGNLQGNGETLTLIKPAASSNDVDVVIDRVRYDNASPWPVAADGTGSAVQLIDPNQDNARVGNWFATYVPAVVTGGSSTPPMTNDGWRFVSGSGLIGSGSGGGQMRLVIYLGTELGTALIDDVWMVDGTNAAVGANFVRNGDFEGPLTDNPLLTNSWMVGTNYTNSTIVSDLTHAGSGALKLAPTTFGNSVTITATTTNNRVIYQALSPAPAINSTNTLSFWYWATNSSTNLNIKIVNSAIGTVNVLTNINITYIPSNYVPPTVVSPATNSLSPGAANQNVTSLPAFQPLWINEVLAENITGLSDSYGQREPWIEIYNTSTNAVSLVGLFLSSSYTNLTNWAFPPGASIGPTQFLVVFCDGQSVQTSNTEYHTSFRLPATSGSVALSRLYTNAPQVLDYVNYAGLHSDKSFGSYPDGQPFDRQEFFYVTPRGTNDGRAAPLAVSINEWLASNVAGEQDPADGAFDDWFEIFNPSSNTVSLAGYYLTDTLADKFKFLITTNMAHTIAAGGHLLVWADNETGQNIAPGGVIRPDLHVNFQLAKAGEALGIFGIDGVAINSVTFGLQTDNVSAGRIPDGGANIVSMPGSASPRAANYLVGPANTPPTLNPIGNKSVNLGQTLTFTATASDIDLPAQVLMYDLVSPPVGATIGAGTGAFSWTPSVAGTFSVTVRVTDNGVPAASDIETIQVQVTGLTFAGPVRRGTNLELTWGTQPGTRYAVDQTTNLNTPIVWQPVLTNTAAGTSLSYTNTTTNGVQRFFRVRSVP